MQTNQSTNWQRLKSRLRAIALGACFALAMMLAVNPTAQASDAQPEPVCECSEVTAKWST
jgi:hypothetical protein